MADEKQIKAIKVFGAEPPKKPGELASGRGRPIRDWAHLVRQISYFDSGKAVDEAIAVQIGKTLRLAKNFPNGADWFQQINAEGAHEKILAIVRGELATTAAK